MSSGSLPSFKMFRPVQCVVDALVEEAPSSPASAAAAFAPPFAAPFAQCDALPLTHRACVRIAPEVLAPLAIRRIALMV